MDIWRDEFNGLGYVNAQGNWPYYDSREGEVRGTITCAWAIPDEVLRDSSLLDSLLPSLSARLRQYRAGTLLP